MINENLGSDSFFRILDRKFYLGNRKEIRRNRLVIQNGECTETLYANTKAKLTLGPRGEFGLCTIESHGQRTVQMDDRRLFRPVRKFNDGTLLELTFHLDVDTITNSLKRIVAVVLDAKIRVFRFAVDFDYVTNQIIAFGWWVILGDR